MRWKATEVTAGWKKDLVGVDDDGRRYMYTAQQAQGRATKWTDEHELICKAFAPIAPGSLHTAKLVDRWDEAMKGDVTVQEVMAYLQGKSPISGPGPSLLRYGHIKHGSTSLKQAVCEYLSAILHGRLGEDDVQIGDTVAWTKDDDDIPSGTKGEVLKAVTDEEGTRWQVRFPSGLYRMLPDQLMRDDSKLTPEQRRHTQRVRGWPTSALQSIITYLRKKAGKTMDKFRPVTLQQALTKMLTGVLAKRIDRVLLEGAVLDPAQSGFVGGGEVGQSLNVLLTVLEHAQQARKNHKGAEGTGELHLMLFDFSNAYTTCPGWLLELAMRRLHMPDQIIDLMVGLVEGQQVAVKTGDGLPRDFALEGGLPHGDGCSPILWAIIMDPILCALREGGEEGWGEQ